MRQATCPVQAKRRQGNTTTVKAICMEETGKWDRSAKSASVPVIYSQVRKSEIPT